MILAISHVIFDCDGVLIDSELISMRIDQRLLARFGIHLSEEELHNRFVGLTFHAMFTQLEQQYHLKFPPDLSFMKDKMMLETYARELQAITGVKDMLEQLPLPCSIATNGPRERALSALDMTGLRPFFANRVTTFEDVKYGKPAPDIYLLAARRAGFAPENCVVVEDSVTGATAALAAGCQVVGFTGVARNPQHSTAALQALGVPRIIHHMTELLVLLGKTA